MMDYWLKLYFTAEDFDECRPQYDTAPLDTLEEALTCARQALEDYPVVKVESTDLNEVIILRREVE